MASDFRPRVETPLTVVNIGHDDVQENVPKALVRYSSEIEIWEYVDSLVREKVFLSKEEATEYLSLHPEEFFAIA